MSQSHDPGHDARQDPSHQHAKADAHDPDDVHEVHEGPIRTPKQLIWTVLAAFVIPVVVIIMLVNFVDFDTKPGAGSDGQQAAAVAQRIKPVGTVDFVTWPTRRHNARATRSTRVNAQRAIPPG
jgi:hypothetical protein